MNADAIAAQSTTSIQIFLKIPAWHDRQEQIIPQPHWQELPKLNEKDLLKVDGMLWQWHHVEYGFDSDHPSATIVLHIYPEETKEKLTTKPAIPLGEVGLLPREQRLY